MFGIVHKVVVHLNGWQQHYARRARILSYLHTVVDHMQTWTMRYKGSPLIFSKDDEAKGGRVEGMHLELDIEL